MFPIELRRTFVLHWNAVEFGRIFRILQFLARLPRLIERMSFYASRSHPSQTTVHEGQRNYAEKGLQCPPPLMSTEHSLFNMMTREEQRDLIRFCRDLRFRVEKRRQTRFRIIEGGLSVSRAKAQTHSLSDLGD